MHLTPSPSSLLPQIIHMHPQAAPKPAMGAACNGCGLCCLAEPCPVGVLLSRSRSGPCKALRWDALQQQYRCGALGTGLQASLVGRWIAAGKGCDCDLEVDLSPTIESLLPPASKPPHD